MISGPAPDPPARPWRDPGDNGGGFINYRPGDPRSRDPDENPRPLDDAERAVLRRAAAPLLADLAASGLPVPDIREEAHEEREESVCGWIQEPDGTGTGISVLLDTSPAGRVAQLAEQFQDWATDRQQNAGRPLDWPACPRHPGAPPHRLTPEVRADRAVWTCWESRQVIWPIGELAMPGGAPPGGRQGRRP